jgi:hypothetical protein
METIKLPDSELSEMKQFYIEEYERTARRLQHIRSVLTRLGISDQELQEGILQVQKELQGKGSTGSGQYAGRRITATAASRKAPKKKGRKSKWELLILKRLRQLDRPVTYDELTDEIMAISSFPDNKRKSTKQAVVNVVFRLRNRDQKLDTFSIGTREKYIALKGWFEKPGEIKKEYANKIERPAAPAKRKRKPSKPRARKKKS